MQPLREFCIASTISLSFLRRKGAIIIWSSLRQSNVQQPPFQNLECRWLLTAFVLFESRGCFGPPSKCLYVWFFLSLHNNCSIITPSFFWYLFIHVWCANLVWFIYQVQCTFSTDKWETDLHNVSYQFDDATFHCIFYLMLLYI